MKFPVIDGEKGERETRFPRNQDLRPHQDIEHYLQIGTVMENDTRQQPETSATGRM
jgi:hypothetical protein